MVPAARQQGAGSRELRAKSKEDRARSKQQLLEITINVLMKSLDQRKCVLGEIIRLEGGKRPGNGLLN
jgi:hypothetical protein